MASIKPLPKALPHPWRETPLIHSPILSKHAGCQIYLKLENLQPSGSFKSRGVGNFLHAHFGSHRRSAPNTAQPDQKIHFYISSGGNAGLACVHAAVTLGCSATIVVPLTTSAYMIAKIRAAGAEDVIQHGESWVEADTYLKEALMVKARERGDKAVYVPPFDDPLIWNGNATIVREISRQLPGVNAPHALVCSVGGGGLFAGLMQGLDDVGLLYTSVLAVETEGAHSLAFSLDRGELSTLSAITSKATSLGARRVAEQAYKEAQRKTVKSIVLSDEEAMEGCVRFANDERFMVEMACGVSLAMCYEGRLKQEMPELESESIVVIVVCGGSNVSAEMLGEWAETIQ